MTPDRLSLASMAALGCRSEAVERHLERAKHPLIVATAADKDDVDKLLKLLEATPSAFALPPSARIEWLAPSPVVSTPLDDAIAECKRQISKAIIAECNRQISKAILGNSMLHSNGPSLSTKP